MYKQAIMDLLERVNPKHLEIIYHFISHIWMNEKID